MPVLTEDSSVELAEVGAIFPAFDFKPKSHWEIGEHAGHLDFERGAKVSGSRFLYYIGQGTSGTTLYISSWRMKKELYKSCHPTWSMVLPCLELVNFRSYRRRLFVKEADETWSRLPKCHWSTTTVTMWSTPKLPVKFTALTPAFRSEAKGVPADTRGLIRHQFNKVEMVQFTKPWNHGMLAKRWLTMLKICWRSWASRIMWLRLTTSDMSFTAAMTHDLEVWLPYQDKLPWNFQLFKLYRFQARRAHIQYRDENGKCSMCTPWVVLGWQLAGP